ncbi:MAG: PHB depolymerase family esterase [Alphaproteobacteria bacterium]|nr:PHB depolymerase family esterase [Alphaproteobacteria bacterium]
MKLSHAVALGRHTLRHAMGAIPLALNGLPTGPHFACDVGARTPFSPRLATVAGLLEVPEFGANPGGLRMVVYAPPAAPPGMPLVVLLHGCGQDAVSFARDSGWIALADRLAFPLLLPEQVAGNNRGGCFNWFRPDDIRRGSGEVASIRQMVVQAVGGFRSDPKRVFVAGLSAGGAMAAALLVAYPEAFAAGAVVGGLPVGCASEVAEALSRMSHAGPALDPAAWAERARRIGPQTYDGPWPALSIWRGGEDRVVDPANGELLAGQWSALHALASAPAADFALAPHVRRQVWGPIGRPVIEMWTLAHLPHAWPTGGDGAVGRWVRPAALAATTEIARFWSLAGSLAPVA